MTAQFWLTISTPLSNLWGISPQAASGIFGVFFIICITALVCIRTKRKDIGVPVFLSMFFLAAMIGIVDWVVFVIVLVIAGALYIKFGHGKH